jgi:hypothetical protein
VRSEKMLGSGEAMEFGIGNSASGPERKRKIKKIGRGSGHAKVLIFKNKHCIFK